MRTAALILGLLFAPLAVAAQGAEPREAEYAMRWDPAEGGPQSAREVFALLGLEAPEADKYEMRYFDVAPASGAPESTKVILRERHESDGKIEIRLKFRRLTPWPASWRCPPDSPYERSEQVDVTLLGAGHVQRVFSYACDLATEDPPAALHATPKRCSVEMARSDMDRIRVEEWAFAGGKRILEISHAAANSAGALASFEKVAAKITARGARPTALSKTALAGACASSTPAP